MLRWRTDHRALRWGALVASGVWLLINVGRVTL